MKLTKVFVTEHMNAQTDLTTAVIEFCRFLRRQSFRVGVAETLAALEACRVGPLDQRSYLRAALRALLCSSRRENEQFDPLFDQYWHLGPPPPRKTANDRPPVNPLGVVTRQKRSLLTFASLAQEASDQTREDEEVAGASLQETLRCTDFSTIPMSQLEELEQLTRRLAEQLSTRLSRRQRPSPYSGRISLRGTIRRNLEHGGEPLHLCFRQRRERKPGLVAFLDISGSMDQYSLFFLRFLHALQQHFRRMDGFLFSTRLTPISENLKTRAFPDSLRQLAEREEAWSSGTRIGNCLKDFHTEYSRSMLSRNTIVLILSDGYDTGAPDLLARQLQRFRGKVRKVIWLNPLLGTQGYEPATAGMQAALPWVDAFLAAHNLQSLLDLESHF